MDLERARGYRDSWLRFPKMVGDVDKERRQRLVWFIGVAGYVMVNGPDFWVAILGRTSTPGEAFALSLPWGVVAVVSIVGYLKRDAYEDARDHYQTGKLAAIESYIAGQNEFSLDSLMNDEHPTLRQLKLDHDRTQKTATFWTNFAGVMVAVGFVVSIFGPVIARCLHP